MNRDRKEIDILSHDRKGGTSPRDLIFYFILASAPVIRGKIIIKHVLSPAAVIIFNPFALI